MVDNKPVRTDATLLQQGSEQIQKLDRQEVFPALYDQNSAERESVSLYLDDDYIAVVTSLSG